MGMMIKRLTGWRSRFDRLSPAAKTSLALIISKFFQRGLGLITGPIFSRIMPMAEYGLISNFTSWQSILYIVATLNMAQGVFNNGMLEFEEDRDSFVFSLLMLANLVTLAFAGVMVIFHQWAVSVMKLPPAMILVMFAYFFMTPAYNYWLGRKRFEYRYRPILWVTAAVSLSSAVLSIIAVLMAPQDGKANAKVLTAEMVSVLAAAVFYVLTCVKGKGRLNVRYWRYALIINLPLVPHYLSMQILSASDRIMITHLVDSSATAIYNVAYTAAAVVLIFWNSVDAAYAPWIYQRMRDKNYAALRRRGEEVILLFAGCAALATLFAPELIRILGPEQYYEGVYVIPSVVAGVFFTAVFALYMRVELYLKKTVSIMVATVLAAAANIGLNALCIPHWGYQAAGYTTLVCYMMLALFHALNLKRLGYGQVYGNRRIALISLGVCVCIVSLSALYTHPVIRYALIAVLLMLGIRFRKKLTGLLRKQR